MQTRANVGEPAYEDGTVGSWGQCFGRHRDSESDADMSEQQHVPVGLPSVERYTSM